MQQIHQYKRTLLTLSSAVLRSITVVAAAMPDLAATNERAMGAMNRIMVREYQLFDELESGGAKNIDECKILCNRNG